MLSKSDILSGIFSPENSESDREEDSDNDDDDDDDLFDEDLPDFDDDGKPLSDSPPRGMWRKG